MEPAERALDCGKASGAFPASDGHWRRGELSEEESRKVTGAKLSMRTHASMERDFDAQQLPHASVVITDNLLVVQNKSSYFTYNIHQSPGNCPGSTMA
ncbi:Hypothetical predicted protein [Podarcis lilfordi]|uniref:Uncharacterized protein n=1 Tax=Podarcis lilfordi TaxID=74358 RepID=A0AA35KF76_9SAUR|nr:Hypothetical predicted protein [Podarcis lilfordi]